ncbi:MAG TPA: TonB-dependent receptor, partial [Candidatus Eisenbacteria bacterium]|nr:TonB-dependent receptor [Candidatus Eisenbacteria bacterium]
WRAHHAPAARGALLAALLLAAAALAPARAGTTGKIAGRVTDPQHQPVAGAQVTVPALHLGAVTDEQGRFTILQVPPGSYDVRAQLIGRKTVIEQGVAVASDLTTRLDIVLEESAVALSSVTVTVKRPVIETNLTSTRAVVSRERIEKLPVQELQDIVNLQAGVVQGHFRGGRTDEVQYQVDGVTVNNPYDQSATVRVDRSLLQEVQVLSGTFDAEYGQAMSGVVNAVLRTGTEKFDWNAEAYGGDFVYPGDTWRGLGYEFHPGAMFHGQLGASGPTPLPATFFLVSGDYDHFDDALDGIRLFEPVDRANFESGQVHPTGDGARVPLAWRREWSGLAKLTNKGLGHAEISYQALLDLVHTRRDNNAFRYNPDGLTQQHTVSLVHGVDLTDRLSAKSFYNLSLRQNVFDYRDMAYRSVWDARYDSAGVPLANPNDPTGAYLQGVDLGRFIQTTNAWVVKGAWVDQRTQAQQWKVGGEFEWPHVRFGAPGVITQGTVNGQQTLVRHVDQPPDYPGIQNYKPMMGAAYAQDEVELNDLALRAGARLDYFDARAHLPSDLANPANAISGAPRSTFPRVHRRASVSPRIGVSYPVGNKAAVFFSYGHFYQFPGLNDIFTNADYSVLARLQASSTSFGVMGNPGIRPERTVQYEFGYKQALGEDLGVSATAFYKDIRDLLGVEFISTYNDAEYARLTNVDFGNVTGFTITLDLRQRGMLSGSIDYTWQTALGNSSDPRETATRAAAGEDPRPRLIPLNWDQRHTLNLTVTLSRPDVFSVSAIGRAASGQPYTPSVASGFGNGLEDNSGRKPGAFVLDVRGERQLRLGSASLSVFGRVFNAFDARFFNGFVFASTGSPDYSRPGSDLAVLADPSRYFAPRRIEVGVSRHGM